MRTPAAVVSAACVVVLALSGSAGAGSSQSRILRLNIAETGIQYLDPALNYDFLGWRLEFATCVRLLSYPDRRGATATRLVPEAAARFPAVSGGGRIYTFRVRSGLRFSDGRAVTAASFVRAVERALHPKMQSPAASFLADVVGAAAFSSGKAKRVAGLRLSGNVLRFRLTEPRADFLSRIAMPFFCAVPPDLPIDPKGVNVLPGAGPYYVASFEPDRRIVLRRNPHYGGTRPQRWDEMRITMNVNTNQSYLQVRRGDSDLDLAGLPPSAHGPLTREFGVNRRRYFVNPIPAINYIALNTSRPFFRDVAARQAIAYAIDRRALARAGGLHAGQVNDQILAPGIPGYRPLRVYPDTPDLARARQLLGERTGTVVLYAGNDPVSTTQAEIIRANLKQVRIDVRVRTFPFAVQIAKTGTRGEPFDMNLIGWFADYPDPYDFINILLYGKTISKTNNVNSAYFNDPTFNRRMEAASRLRGRARERAYAALDRDLVRAAPFVVFQNPTAREFVSARIGCPMFGAVVGGLNLVMLCERNR
jgi:peptide/nickel transport system substrate-binding protein